MQTEAPYRILFVCLGNICRSPAAEIVFRAMLDRHDLSGRVEVDSAGTIDYHRGNPPDERMLRALKSRGYAYGGHRSRPVKPGDWEHFDLIVAMDAQNMRDLRRLAGSGEHRARLVAMCDYAVEFGDTEVPDPYWSGDEGFLYVVRLLEDCCGGLLQSLPGSVTAPGYGRRS